MKDAFSDACAVADDVALPLCHSDCGLPANSRNHFYNFKLCHQIEWLPIYKTV